MLTHETLINYEKPFINKCVIKYGDINMSLLLGG